MSTVKIAIAVHIYHPELWEEIASYLIKIDAPFDLFITGLPEKIEEITSVIKVQFPKAIFKKLPNKGMDALLFLSLIPEFVESKYHAVCKLYTKKGRGEAGPVWRQALLQGLVGSNKTMEVVCQAFIQNDNLAMIGTGEFYLSTRRISYNPPLLQKLCDVLTVSLPFDNWGYFAGSMYWVRPEVLLPITLVVRKHSPELFRGDDSQTQHALEEIIGLIPLANQQSVAHLLPAIGGKFGESLQVHTFSQALKCLSLCDIYDVLHQHLRFDEDRTLLLRTGLFDNGEYLLQFPNLSGAQVDLLSHYLLIGQFQGATPYLGFSHCNQPKYNNCFSHVHSNEGYLMKKLASKLLYNKSFDKLEEQSKFRENQIREGGSNNVYKEKLISIVTPVYYTKIDFLDNIYNDLLGVSEEVEWIIVNDSPDDADLKDKIKSFIKRGGFVKYEENPSNLGIYKSYLRGFEIALGKYCAIVDHDDRLDLSQDLIKILRENKEFNILYTNEYKFSDANNDFEYYDKPNFDILSSIYYFYTHHITFFENRFLKKAIPNLKREKGDYKSIFDICLFLEYVKVIHPSNIKAKKIKLYSYGWRVHEGSTAMDIKNKPIASIERIKKAESFFKNFKEEALIKINPEFPYSLICEFYSVDEIYNLNEFYENGLAFETWLDSIESRNDDYFFKILNIDYLSRNDLKVLYFLPLEYLINSLKVCVFISFDDSVNSGELITHVPYMSKVKKDKLLESNSKGIMLGKKNRNNSDIYIISFYKKGCL